MAIYHNQNLGALFNDIIGYLPTYFQTVTNIYKGFYGAFLDEGKTGNDTDDPFTRSYNWCYGFSDFAEDIIEGLGNNAPDNFDGTTRAPCFAHFWELLRVLAGTYGLMSYGINGSKRPYLPIGGTNCVLKILRYDNTEITNAKLKQALSQYNNISHVIRSCGNLSTAGHMLWANFPIDFSGKASTELNAMTFRQVFAYVKTRPLRLDGPNNSFDIIRARQAVSYAEYELRKVLENIQEQQQAHLQSCAECEENGECDEYLALLDAESECEDNIVNYIATKCGGYGAEFADSSAMLDPYGYYSSSYSGQLKYITNPLRFIAVHAADVPIKTYTGNMGNHTIGATWNDLKTTGTGYKSRVYNVVLERTLALPAIQFDTAETDYTNGNPFYIKSNMWAWLNSLKDGRENNDKLWRELQHTGDTNTNSNFYRGYLSCIDDDLRKHSVTFVERDQLRSNSGGYLSTTIARLSYATIGAPVGYYKNLYSDEKVGTTSITRGWNYQELTSYGGYYQKVFANGGESALKAARKAVYPESVSSYYKNTSAGVATRTTVGATVNIAVLNTSGEFIAKAPKDYVAARPIHRLFPFHLTEKYGVPRAYTKGITLEAAETSDS